MAEFVIRVNKTTQYNRNLFFVSVVSLHSCMKNVVAKKRIIINRSIRLLKCDAQKEMNLDRTISNASFIVEQTFDFVDGEVNDDACDFD
ncbi:hypothetical protein PPL_08754 [Heterostelium album PN500]|uniref:Uncharacterized protein n=1 Tax=Heterostelium pallidum (strain ATCC 26659 / Pp 5 / PN500) TaxID=670386 RepID=D3BJM6_HETP5|nr:hypothetical protein PPL_08754 [Heterostelium album PN500]EFA78106.1 hypothetical protein PPL_08754 [Heterostelium album PN500]|eukprot:XP_020430233.1 hypothetical protein PPL_08754 [Heterostelium album PN500]